MTEKLKTGPADSNKRIDAILKSKGITDIGAYLGKCGVDTSSSPAPGVYIRSNTAAMTGRFRKEKLNLRSKFSRWGAGIKWL